MKSFPLLIATLAIPASLAFAQTTTPGTTTSSSIPFIPLIGSTTAGTGGTATSTAWFVDVAKNQVVLCAQSTATPTGGAAGPSFTCTAQPVPAATTPTATTTPATTAAGG